MTYHVGIGDANENITNSRTDWSAAKRHKCEFAIVRGATTGAWLAGKPAMRPDAAFPMNAEQLADNSIKRLTYGWFDPRVKLCPAVAQADTLLEAVRDYGPGELGLGIDLEDVSRSGIYAYIGVGQQILSYLIALEAATGHRPRIYTNADYVMKYLFNSQVREAWLIDYELLVASWSANAPTVPQPWAPLSWRAWQYRANAPGAYYGFHNADPRRPAYTICMAVWNGDLE